jgi:hypothetical protein
MGIQVLGKSPNLYPADNDVNGNRYTRLFAGNSQVDIFSYFPKRYSLPVGTVGRQTGTPAAGAVLWAVRNLGATPMYIKRVQLYAAFDGTAAATTQRYYLTRFRTATPTGGTALTAVKMDTTMDNGQTIDAREAVAGLTVTSVTYDTEWLALNCQRQVSATQKLEFVAPDIRDAFVVPVNDGICIRLGVAGVIGDSLVGLVEWGEL